MKKRLLCLFLCGCLACSFWGCDNSSKKAPSSSNTEESTDSNTEDNSENTGLDENVELSTPDISAEALKKEQARDSTIDLDNCNWNSTCFLLQGEKYQLPFSYARISDKWTFDITEYGYDESFRLQPGERTTATVELTNSDLDYAMVVGFYNPYDVEITLEEAKIWSVSFDLTNSIATAIPYLPQGMSKGSTLGDGILAYGSPSVPFTHDYDAETFEYHYVSDYNRFVTLVFHETKGLLSFTIQNYGF